MTASHADMAKFMKIAGLDNQRLKTAMIIGGGRISYYLATQLIESGTRVKIIEQDRNKCIELSEYVPKHRLYAVMERIWSCLMMRV